MKTIIMEPNFDNVEADVLVIGVPEHPENITGWDGFVSSFSSRLPEWVKSGDIKTEFQKYCQNAIHRSWRLQACILYRTWFA